MWTPPRSSAPELLDGQPPGDALLARNLREMAVLNRLTGGGALAWRAIMALTGGEPGPWTLLEIAAGNGTGGQRLVQQAQRAGMALRLLSSDLQPGVARIARDETGCRLVLVSNACALPLADQQVDLVYCAQSLHHFAAHEVVEVLGECARVARHGWVLTDLRRSWLSYWGARLVALGPLTSLGRHDGPLSVLRAYTPAELRALTQSANLAETQIIAHPIHLALIWRRLARASHQ